MFILLILFALVLLLLLFVPHKEADATFRRGMQGRVNFNGRMSDFVFRVEISKADLLHGLSVKNIHDSTEFQLDIPGETITFEKNNARTQYIFQITEADGICILRLKQIPLVPMGLIPYHINDFLIRKVDVIPLPYFPDSGTNM